MYILLKVTELILQNIPRKAGYFVFETFAMIAFVFSKKRKETLKKNIGNVLGTRDIPASILKEIYKNYARYYFDLFTPVSKLLSAIKTEKYCEAAINDLGETIKSKGAIALSCHIGNWDFGGAYLAYKFPGNVTVVVEKLSPGIFRWFIETREKCGMKVVDAADIKSILRALKNKEILLLMTDRDLSRNGLITDLFGKPAYIPGGPSRLGATEAGLMVLGAVLRKKEDPFEFIPVIETIFVNSGNQTRTKENIEEASKTVIIKMEALLKSNPEQWCMLQEVWVAEIKLKI